VTSPFDHLTAECLLCGELVVSATANPDVFLVVFAAEGTRVNVVELEEGAGLAAAAVRRDVRASQAVAFEDFAAGGARYAVVRRRAARG
jgi:hypothetical protein